MDCKVLFDKRFKQDCPNGQMNYEEFVGMYKMFFPGGNAEQFCEHAFRTFDTGKKGYLDFKEFILAIDMTNAGTAEEKLKVAFRMYDLDGDDKISKVIFYEQKRKHVICCYDNQKVKTLQQFFGFP